VDGHQIDGELARWDEIQEEATWDTLLLGNGFSINLWRGFTYASLYEEAERGTRFGGLTGTDKRLFAKLGTENFELVLRELRSALQMAELLHQDPSPYQERYGTVQLALGAAIRSVHIDRVETPEATLAAIRPQSQRYTRIFTTCYDLMLYWAMGYGETFDGFRDCFWSDGNRFDPNNADIWGGTAVYFLHGAMHLIVEGSGVTRKLTRDHRTLLEQFGQPIPGDTKARPLLITEGSSQDKIRAIDNNEYLTHCLKRFEHHEDPLVVFGHGLGEQDQHLVDAINGHPDRAVAVSVRPGTRKAVRAWQARFRAKLDTPHLYFFDSTTHPLGDPKLTKHQRFRDRLRGGRAA
jgi:Domain of unknown function (DUF4917)